MVRSSRDSALDVFLSITTRGLIGGDAAGYAIHTDELSRDFSHAHEMCSGHFNSIVPRSFRPKTTWSYRIRADFVTHVPGVAGSAAVGRDDRADLPGFAGAGDWRSVAGALGPHPGRLDCKSAARGHSANTEKRPSDIRSPGKRAAAACGKTNRWIKPFYWLRVSRRRPRRTCQPANVQISTFSDDR